MSDITNSPAYQRGVERAKIDMEKVDLSTAIDKSDQMPCGCHWRAPGHGRGGCPKNA